MDSLGLGLTLDTTLLEKADKTLENMQKNSQLIMQNLTRGFTAFNEGKMGNFTQVFDDVSKAMDRLSKAKVSPDFDTKGQEKYIDRMEHLLTIVEKMSKIDNAKFFDPTEVYATDKRPDEIFAEMGELKEYKEKLQGLIEVVNNYGETQSNLSKQARKQKEDISKQENEVKKLVKTYEEAEAKFNSSMDALSKFRDDFFDSKRKKKPSLTDEEIQEMYSSSKSKTKTTLLKQLEEERVAINEAKKALDNAYKDLSKKRESLSKTTTEYKGNQEAKKNIENIKLAYDNIKEREKILQKELEFSKATEAERAAMLTRRNEAEIKADQKRIRDVQKSYETLRKEIQKGEKDIETLKYSGKQLKESGKSTKEITAEISNKKAELNKLMQVELEFRSGEYWPKLQAIDEKYRSEEFIKRQKEESKKEAKKSRKDVTAALLYSKNAQSINEEKEAIKRLMEARDNLSTSTARYKKTVEDINKRILAHKDHIDAVTRVEKEQNTLADSVINRYRKQLKALDDVNEALEKQMKIERKTSVADLDPTNADTQALLARQKTIADDIADIESRAQGQLDTIREQHEAERSKKRIDETLRQNEREKQEYAKLLDDLYALEKQKKAMKDAGANVGDKAYYNILLQEADLKSRKSQLEEKHQTDLDEIQKKHNKKRNDDDVKAFIEAEKEKQRIAEETQRKIDEYNEKYGTTSKRNAEMAITSFRGAQNINQHKQAIEGLQQVRARLDNTDKDYYETLKKLNREIHSHELFIRAAENESVRLGNSHRGLMDISGQLMRRLALVFSVSQITQYFRKLVEVRGQFEKTEVALTSIIQSQEKAKKLMNQTIALAIKSPFTLQQLTGYTKQLAAYQVEYKDLYNTTKMLADVSAGLGVEMDRLILAFGQVKAANYLRATEVRQFTEAGFNILGELAKYYSELEGTMVSVGDVQERVTKRMVDFADVEEIFHRVTEAGGMFYEMQSKQAETLAGQWTNLQDRIDVMLNEIGTSGDGVLKFIVKMLASAIDNWEVLASSIKTAATAFIIFKTYSLLAGDGMKLLAIQMGVLTDSVPKVLSLGQAFKTLRKAVVSAVTKIGASMGALLTNPVFLAVAAIGALVSAGVSLYRHFDKMKDALKEQSDSFNEYTSSLSKLSREFGKLDKFTEKLAKLEELKGRLNERGLALSVKIDEVDAENIDKIFAENSEILQKSYDLGLSVGNAITKGLNAAQGNVFGWSLFGENLAEDAEDFAEKWNKLASYGMDAQMTSMTNEIEATIAAMNDMTEEERSTYAEMLKIYETIKDGRKAERDDKGKIIKYTESEYEWTIRRATALKQIQDLEDGSVTKNNKLARYLRQVARQERELNHEVENTVNKLAKEFGGLEKLMQAAKENPVEFSAAIQAEIDKQAWDDVTKWVYSQKLHARLDIKPNYVEDPSRTDSEKLAQFQQDLMSARTNLKGVKDGYQNFFISEEEIKNMKFFSDGLEGIQKLYDENKKTIEQLEGTSDEYSKEELARLNALQKELEVVAEKWDYNLNEGKYEKGASRAVKILQKRIGLLKEVNQKYLELVKTFDADTAKEKVMDAYADTFREAFAGTGVDLDLYKVMTQVITDSKKVGEEMGSNLSEGVINKLKELKGAGTYIRSATEDIIEFTKAEEAFRPNAYLDKLANVWTIGYGTTSKAGIGVNVVEGMVIDQAKAEEWLLKTYKSKEQILNSILDKHKDLIITQEQYNALLDAAYNGEGASKAIEFAYGSWEHFESYLNSLKAMKQVNKKAVIVDVEEIKKEWEALDTIQEKLALTLKWSGIRTGGKVSSALQDRAIKRAEMFSGDLDIANQLENVLVRIAGMDFTTTEGLIEALGKLKEIAEKEGPEAKNILSQAISGLEAEMGVRLKEDADKELKDEVQSLFDQYDLSVELKKLNIPSDLAKSLFDIDYLDLDGLKKAVQDQESKFVGTDMVDEYKKFLEKIDDLEDKQQLERLKKYVEYAKKGLSERAKIKLEELKKLQEIEETFKIEEGDSEETRQAKEATAESASKAVREESQKAMNKLEWEEFEKSDTFINIFDDIDNASTTLLNHMIGRLEEFKEQWKDMPLEDVNKIIEKLNLLQEKLAKAKPSEAAKKARDEIKAARGQIEMEGVEKIEFEDKEAKELAKKRGKGGFFAAMDEEQAYQDQQKEAAQEQISLLETALRIKEGTATASDKVLEEETKVKEMLKLSDDELKDQLKTQQGIVSNADKQNGKIQKARQNQKNLTAAQKAQYDAIKDSVDMANDLYSAFKELVEVLDADDPAMVFADMGMNILSSIPTMLTLIAQIHAATIAAEGLGAAMNMAMGIVGLIVMAIQLLVQAISAAVNYAEKMRQMKLDVLAGQVDNLKKKYDALAESIDKAYSTKQLQEYSKEIDKVQAKMEDAQRDYIKLLESGKDGDTIKIAKEAQRKLDAGLSVDSLSNKERKALLSEEYKDYKDATEALAEMQEDYEEQKQDLLDSMGGVTDYKSEAQEFVDAWVDAFQETGDGLSGLQENFREFFDNVIKQEAMRRVTDKYMEPFFDDLNAALESESSLSEEEIADLKAKADKVAPELSKVLEELWIALGGSKGEAGGLSALQKGISSISEQTAQVLEAYLNSVRMYVATISADTTSQLNEVKAIHRLLDSVTRGGHPMGGAGFKVFMD